MRRADLGATWNASGDLAEVSQRLVDRLRENDTDPDDAVLVRNLLLRHETLRSDAEELRTLTRAPADPARLEALSWIHGWLGRAGAYLAESGELLEDEPPRLAHEPFESPR